MVRWTIGRHHGGETYNSHKLSNVLQLLLACVFEVDVELALCVLLNASRNADAAGLRYPFQTYRNIDPITKDIIICDDNITDVNADAKLDPLSCGTSVFRSAMPR